MTLQYPQYELLLEFGYGILEKDTGVYHLVDETFEFCSHSYIFRSKIPEGGSMNSTFDFTKRVLCL